jgi:hypothetical protein
MKRSRYGDNVDNAITHSFFNRETASKIWVKSYSFHGQQMNKYYLNMSIRDYLYISVYSKASNSNRTLYTLSRDVNIIIYT